MRCRSLRAAGPSRETPIETRFSSKKSTVAGEKWRPFVCTEKQTSRFAARAASREGNERADLIDGQKRFAAVEQDFEDGPRAGQRIDDRLPGDLVGQAT